jgi:hypothetical protein
MPFYTDAKKGTQSLEDLFESPAASQQIRLDNDWGTTSTKISMILSSGL